MSLKILGTYSKLNHAIFVLLYLGHFMQYKVFKFHSCCTMPQNVLPFFRLNNISLYTCHLVSLPLMSSYSQSVITIVHFVKVSTDWVPLINSAMTFTRV